MADGGSTGAEKTPETPSEKSATEKLKAAAEGVSKVAAVTSAVAGDAGDGGNIKVAIRVRPFNSREKEEEGQGGTERAFNIRRGNMIEMCLPEAQRSELGLEGEEGGGMKPKTFGFDHVFASFPGEPCFGTQKDVYEAVGIPLLENAINSFNGCLFAYGQTGSGKSHSVLGDPEDEDQKGILPRACEHLFSMLEREKEKESGAFSWNVLATYLEIYNEKLSDLLVSKGNAKELQVRLHPQHGAHVPGLTEAPVSNYSDINAMLDMGASNRIIAATKMNAQSSRSHAVFTVDVHMTRVGKDSHSHIHFVDLAGSERQKKTGASGDRLKEGIAINQSLTALGRVINTLTAGKKGAVPPFRESKLTLLLKEALSGNSRTILVACVSPSMFNAEETTSTLEFASRCKMIKTSAKKNEIDRKDVIEALEAEKAAVESMLARERADRQKDIDRINEERAQREALQAEMEAIQKDLEGREAVRAELERQKALLEQSEQGALAQLQAAKEDQEAALAKVSQAEAQKREIQEERERASRELEEQRKKLAEASEASREEMEKSLKKLEDEQAAKEAMAKERESALEQVAKAETERAQIQAERERAFRELEEQRAKLAQTEAAGREEIEAHVKRLEEENQAKEALIKERAAALEQVSQAEAERAQIAQEKARAQEELDAQRAKLAEAEEASRAEIEATVKRLEMEQAEKAALTRERESALEQVSLAEREKVRIQEEREKALEELQAERLKLAEAEETKKEELLASVKRLEEEQAAKQVLAREREAALEQVSRAERERAQINADREAALAALEEERRKLTQAEEANRAEIEATVRRLEAEKEAKEKLTREREAALEQVTRAEQERLAIKAQREAAVKELEQERAKLAHAEESQRAEMENTLRRLEAEQEAKQTLAREREAALEEVSKAEMERAEIQADREKAQAKLAELEKERSRLSIAQQSSRSEVEAAIRRLEEEQKDKEKLAQERTAALEQVSQAEQERARIQAEREAAQQQLEQERAKLAAAEESSKAEIETAIKRLEEEAAQKAALAKERSDALEQVAKVERERAQISAERDRAKRELEEERIRLEASAGENRHQVEEALQKLEREQAEKEALSREREDALAQVARAEKERLQIQADREAAQKELEEQRNKLAETQEANKEEVEQAVKRLEEEQKQREALAQEREAVLNKLREENAEKEALFREKQQEQERAEKMRQEREQAMQEVERQKQMNELNAAELLRLEKEAASKLEEEKSMRERLEKLQEMQEAALQKEQEKAAQEEKMNQELANKQAKEQEMQHYIADLQSRLEKTQLVADDTGKALEARKKELEDRQKAMDNSCGAGNLSEEERVACPTLVNLSSDKTLSGSLTFYLDKKTTGGILLGSDETCELRIEGLGVCPKTCTLWNVDDKKVFVSLVQADAGGADALVCINGEPIEDEDSEGRKRDIEKMELQDGDRLAIGHAYIFEVSLPLARREEFRKKQESAENMFQKAIKEMEENAILDKRWRNVVNTATKLVRERYGTEEANVLLAEAQTASFKISEANALLSQVKDNGHKLDVKEYELAVLFDASGLPLLSVVARRTQEGAQHLKEDRAAKRALTRQGSQSLLADTPERKRDGSDIAGMWSVTQFTEEKLEDLKQAHETMEGLTIEDYRRHWAALAWGEVPISTYRAIGELDETTAAGREARRQAGIKSADDDAGFFSGWFGGRSKAAKAGPSPTKEAGKIVEDGDGNGIGDVLYNWFGMGDSAEDKVALAQRKLRDGLNKAKKVLRPGETKEHKIKKRQQVTVPRLLDGKLGVKLKGGTLVVGFDHPEAEQFGWHLNDEIVEVNGHEVSDRDSFARQYMTAKKKMPIVFTVFRSVGGPVHTSSFGLGLKKRSMNTNRYSSSVPPNARLDSRVAPNFNINVLDTDASDGQRNLGSPSPRDRSESATGSEGARRKTSDSAATKTKHASLTVAPDLAGAGVENSAGADGRSSRLLSSLPLPTGSPRGEVGADGRPLGPRTTDIMRESVQLDPDMVADLQIKPPDKE